jgi:hypothetical protein
MNKRTKARQSRQIASVPRSVSLLGKTHRTTLRYIDQKTFPAGTAGVPEYRSYRCNGPNDPEVAAGGTQPFGYDQFATFFQRYTVLGCRIRATFLNGADTLADMGIFGIYLSATTPPPTTTAGMLGQPLTKYVGFAPVGSGKAVVDVHHSFDPKQFFGMKDPVGTDAYGADIGSNPVSQAYFNVFCAGVITTTNNPLSYVTVCLEYDVLFHEPQAVAAS